MDTCLAHCRTHWDCLGFEAETLEHKRYGYMEYNCDLYTSISYREPYLSWGYSSFDGTEYRKVLKCAVNEDYFKSNLQNMVPYPDGVIGNTVDGFCDHVNTNFGTNGLVSYRKMTGIEFITADEKNIIESFGAPFPCARKCFELAGCSSFYSYVPAPSLGSTWNCKLIIGRAARVKNDATGIHLVHAGMLHDGLCPSLVGVVFSQTFTKISEFVCVFQTPDEAKNLADSIIETNTGNANTPLHRWTHTTEDNPFRVSSQYVTLSMPNMQGNDRQYRRVPH